MTVLADPGMQMTIDDVRRAVDRFAPPQQAYATLGLRNEAMWLRVPLQVRGAVRRPLVARHRLRGAESR